MSEKTRIQFLQASSVHNWFMFRRDFVKHGVFSRDQALFYQDLVNLYERPGTKIRNGFFLCTVGFLESSMNWSRSAQARFIDRLTQRGFIETEHHKKDQTRWIKIHADLVEDELMRLKDLERDHDLVPHVGPSQKWDPPSPRSGIPLVPHVGPDIYRRKKTEEKQDRPLKRDGLVINPLLGNIPPNPVEELASRLLFRLKGKGLILRKNPNKTKWVKSIEKIIQDKQDLLNIGEVKARKRVEEILDWYSEHVGEEFVPNAHYSAQRLYDKFPQLEDAMKRSGRNKDILDRGPGREVKVTFWISEDVRVERKPGVVTTTPIKKVWKDVPCWQKGSRVKSDDGREYFHAEEAPVPMYSMYPNLKLPADVEVEDRDCPFLPGKNVVFVDYRNGGGKK